MHRVVPGVIGRQKYFCQPQLAVTGHFRQPCKLSGRQKIWGRIRHQNPWAGKHIFASPPPRGAKYAQEAPALVNLALNCRCRSRRGSREASRGIRKEDGETEGEEDDCEEVDEAE